MTMNMMQKASLAATFANAKNQQKGQATFLGIKPPLEIEQLSVTLNATPLDKNQFRKVLAFVFEYMKGTDINETHWAQLKEAVTVDEVILSTVFSGALSLIRATTRGRIPLEQFTTDSVDVLKIPKEFVVEMGLAIQNWYVSLQIPSLHLLLNHFHLFSSFFSSFYLHPTQHHSLEISNLSQLSIFASNPQLPSGETLKKNVPTYENASDNLVCSVHRHNPPFSISLSLFSLTPSLLQVSSI